MFKITPTTFIVYLCNRCTLVPSLILTLEKFGMHSLIPHNFGEKVFKLWGDEDEMIHGLQFSVTSTMQMDKKVVIIIWSQNQIMNSFKFWSQNSYLHSYFLQFLAHSYVLSRNRLNSNIWHHYLIIFINNFPMTCQSLQYNMIYIF